MQSANKSSKSPNYQLYIIAGLTIILLGLPIMYASEGESRHPAMEGVVQLFNSGDFSLLPEIYTADFTRHHVAFGNTIKGLDEMKSYVRSLRESYPDFKVTADETLLMGDRAVLRWTVTGTNTGPLQGPTPEAKPLPATGKTINLSGVSILKIKGNKIAEEIIYWDQTTTLTQLGFTITPPAPTARK